MCLGPFEDEEDRLKKIREDNERERKKADLDRAAIEVALNSFRRKKKQFDEDAEEERIRRLYGFAD